MNNIVISGYYGFGNSGDDALLLSIINDFDKKGLKDKIIVLSNNPKETKSFYGVKAVSRVNPFALLFSIFKARLFISGGGTLMQDGTSTKSLIYYLMLIKLAKLFGKKVMLYANGIGPINKAENRKRCQKVLNKVDAITLRDEKSLGELKNLSVTKPNIIVSADPVFLLESGEKDSAVAKKYCNGKKILALSVRKPKTDEAGFVTSIASAVRYGIEKYDFEVAILPMQERDKAVSQKLAKEIGEGAFVVSEKMSPQEMMKFIEYSYLCVGMRLHTLIYAAASATPLIGIVYDPKVSGFMEYANQRLFVNVENLSADELITNIDKCLRDYETIKKSLDEAREKLVTLAGKNIEEAVRLYELRR